MTEQQIVIIGGSEGIGLAVAKAARAIGARVLAVSRTRAKLEAARAAVRGLEIRVADINGAASIQQLFSELSTLDHVYIAAGSSTLGGPLDHPLSDFRHKFDEPSLGLDWRGSCRSSSHASRWFIYLYWRPFFRPPCERPMGEWHCDDGDGTIGARSRSGTCSHSLQCRSTRSYRYADVGPYLPGEGSASARRRHEEIPDPPSGDRR